MSGCTGPSGTSSWCDVATIPWAPTAAHATATAASGLGTTQRLEGIAPARSNACTVARLSVSSTSAHGGSGGVGGEGEEEAVEAAQEEAAAEEEGCCWWALSLHRFRCTAATPLNHSFTTALHVRLGGPAAAAPPPLVETYGAPVTFVAFVFPPIVWARV